MKDRAFSTRITRIVLVLCTALALLLPAANTARAAGVVGDGSSASCTEAALTAALAGGGTVTFNCGGPKSILILSAKTIAQDTLIDGGGQITITGGLTTRLFAVQAGATLTLHNIVLDSAFSTDGSDGGAIRSSGTLRLANVTIQNSQVKNEACGGAIRSDGMVFVANSTFRNNTGGTGGAICMVGGAGRLEIAESAFTGNKALNPATGTGGAIHVGDNAQLIMNGGGMSSNVGVEGGALYVSPLGTAMLAGSGLPMSIIDNRAGETGGAITNHGTLTVIRANFIGNAVEANTIGVGYGGALASLNSLTLRNSFFRSNTGRFGGAVFVGGSLANATATIERASFSQNTATMLGGGLYTNAETTTITVKGSRFNGNSASTGGGIARFSAKLQLENSSVTQNSATSGGGMWIAAGPQPTNGGYVRLRSVTISSNQASSNQGGGVLNSGQVELYHTTIVNNTNGVYSTSGGNTRFRSSVLHNPGSLNCDGDGTAQISDDARNYSTDTSCILPSSTTGAGLDPKLDPLTIDPQSLTSYHMPQAGSPLINNGFNCPPTDQRGATRPDACDIGAVEYRGLLPRSYMPLLMR